MSLKKKNPRRSIKTTEFKFGPRNKKEAIVFAEEKLRVDIQHELFKAMKRNGVSVSQLARRLGIGIYDVERFFSSGCDISIKLLARIFHVLGEEIQFSTMDK